MLKLKILIQNDPTVNVTADATNTGIKDFTGVPTTLTFQSTSNIDPADYKDPVTGVVNYNVLQNINPYYLNYVVYIDDPNINPLSVTKQNDDLHFYLWPKNPCY